MHACTAKSEMTWEESLSSREENPRSRCKVFLSMQNDVRFSCDQLNTKRLSSLILQPNEVSNLRLRLARGIKGSLQQGTLLDFQKGLEYTVSVEECTARERVLRSTRFRYSPEPSLWLLYSPYNKAHYLHLWCCHKRKPPGGINQTAWLSWMLSSLILKLKMS